MNERARCKLQQAEISNFLSDQYKFLSKVKSELGKTRKAGEYDRKAKEFGVESACLIYEAVKEISLND